MTTQFDLERRIELANKIEEEIKGNYSGGARETKR